MLSFPASVRIFLCTEPVDLRKSFNSLPGEIRRIFRADPLSGHLFVFSNRRRNQLKIIYWDRDGYAIWSKRFDRGTFNLNVNSSDNSEINYRKLTALLQGIEPAKFRKRFSRDNSIF